jgi:Ca2+-transporting ATPase
MAAGCLVVQTDELVPGDVVLLEAGNLVPADLRLHEVAQLRVDESALTGESVTVEKSHARRLPHGEHPLGDRVNMAWKGTLVTHGRAAGLVVATGAGTQLGQVATLLGQAGDKATPLQQRLAAFGKKLSIIVIAICAAIFAFGVLRGEPVLLMALTAISLAVAAIPEALPAVVTVLLALGARRLAKAHALVRRLPSVETLGSVSVICSDKTGTLTLNRMQLREHRAWAGKATRRCGRRWRCATTPSPATTGTGWATPPRPRCSTPWPTPGSTWWRCAWQPAPARVALRRRSQAHEHAAPATEAGSWRAYVKGAPESVLPRCGGGPEVAQALDTGREPGPRRACACWRWRSAIAAKGTAMSSTSMPTTSSATCSCSAWSA